MTEELKNHFITIRDKYVENFYKIKDIFNEYFTEERVDWQLNEVFQIERVSKSILHLLEEYNLITQEIISAYANDELTSEQEQAIISALSSTFEDAEALDDYDYFSDLDNYIEYTFGKSDNTITIYFPEVIVTNENGDSTKIKKLFVRVYIERSGKLGYDRFKLLRTHYTFAHFKNNYMHSHVNNISTSFQSCCTGRGPINDTMNNLRYELFNESQWLQFCWDLDKYVTVESLEGIPYHKLKDCNLESSTAEEISVHYGPCPTIFESNNEVLKDFTRHLISTKKIKFSWRSGEWKLAHSYAEFALIVSKEFLLWAQNPVNFSKYLYYPEEDRTRNRLKNYFTEVIYNSVGMFVPKRTTFNCAESAFRGINLLNFKGTNFVGEIDAPVDNNTSLVAILKPSAIRNIYNLLLRKLNTCYGRNTNKICSEKE